MDYVSKLENLKDEFKNLKYRNEDEKNKLVNKLKIYVDRIFNANPIYVEEIQSIKFFRMHVKEESEKVNAWESGKTRCIGLIENMIDDLNLFSEKPATQIINLTPPTKVFIVHGHDNQAKEQVARTIEKMGLEAVILHEQVNSGKTIIEKIESNTDVGFGIVLYTPCDVGNSKSNANELNARARQNVIFEHGFLVAKLGREKVVALVKGDIEKPSDIDGVVYEPMDVGGAWKYRIANEMNEVGFGVDLNKI